MIERRVGIVGYGVMGRAHAYAYRTAPLVRPHDTRFVPVVMSGRDAERVRDVASVFGAESECDWRALIERPDVDVVDICTPPGTHAEIAIAAAEAGKDVVCEKPLALNSHEAEAALTAVRGAGVRHAVGFNYRRLPALSLLAELVRDGALGEVRLFRGTWLSDEFVDPATPFDWRFDRSLGGTTIADLGSHLVDLATWIIGPISAVAATSSTFVTERPAPQGPRPVEIDDASSALVRFASGAQGTLEMARSAPRRPCDFVVEVNGSVGTAVFSYARLNELWVGSTEDDPHLYGLRRVRAEMPSHPETGGWWPVGQGVGYDASLVNQAADLAAAWPDDSYDPDFAQGAAVVRVCEAIEHAAEQGRWVSVEPEGVAHSSG